MTLPITVDLCTRGRYFSTLPLAIQSIISQTQLPEKIIIYDDTEKKIDLRTVPLYQYLFSNMKNLGIDFEVLFGNLTGQVRGHQIALERSKTDLIFRMDDDEIIPHNLLETFYNDMREGEHGIKNVGAVSCLIHDPTQTINPIEYPHAQTVNRITDIFNTQNFQWTLPTDRKFYFHAEHLYSSFLYDRTKCNGYEMTLSPVGHREETIFTHEIFRKGYQLLINSGLIIWHYRNPEGGIRDTNVKPEMFERDEGIFRRKMSSWNIKLDKNKILVLSGGIGDCFACLNHLSKLLEQTPDLVVATYHPNVFQENMPNLSLIHPSIAIDILGKDNYEKQNIYGWAARNNWTPDKGNLVKIYEEFLKENFQYSV